MIIQGGTIRGGTIKGSAVVVAPTMRSVLSSAGQTAYDAASSGNWFTVSNVDYGNVVSGLSSVTKYGLNDTQLSVGGSAWSAGYAQAFGAYLNAQVSSGTYIIGFVGKISSGTGGITPLISNALPTTGTYSPIAGNAIITSGALGYYLRRAPSAVAVTSYLGIVSNVTALTNSTINSGITSWYTNTGGPINYGAPWTSYNANPLLFQALGTSTYQWT